jgi:hypothetical protein
MLARDNPFATNRVEQLLRFNPEWSGTTWEHLDKKWGMLERRATVTGRHGAGKTCFLDAWAARHTKISGMEPVRIFLNREQNTMTDTEWQTLAGCHGKTIILDGEEQLGFRARNKFYNLAQHASGILVTRHVCGKLPTFLHLNPSMKVLLRCIQHVAPEHSEHLSRMLPKMWKKHHANLRSILLECYDVVANL